MDESLDSAGDITQLLRRWSAGDSSVSGDLLQLTYERLRQLAGICMSRERSGHTLQPTALVGELYLRLATSHQSGWIDRDHFYSFCARAMRWILTDHAKTRLRGKRRCDLQLPLVKDIPWLGGQDNDIADLDLALEKLAAIDQRKAQVLELRIYLGCTAGEAAQILHLSKATVDRDLTLARAWLCRELRPANGTPAARADDLPE